MNDTKLTVEYMDITALKPYERNARKHEPKDIAAIRKSIEDFGFNDPIGIWHDTIVEGHGRLLAAKDLGMTEVPVIRLDHLDDEGRRAYAIAHNKTAENSEWDMPVLKEELRDLEKYFDMTDFGFDMNTEETENKERKEIDYVQTISVVIDCENEQEAERIFTKLQEEGYECRISTL